MKIFDCFMYFDEDVVLDVRLNFLNSYVDKFVIVESIFNHKGEKRKPQFDISKYSKFKDKIIYILKDDIPEGIEKIEKSDDHKEVYRKSILNAGKREKLQRNNILDGLKVSQFFLEKKVLISFGMQHLPTARSRFISFIERKIKN